MINKTKATEMVAVLQAFIDDKPLQYRKADSSSWVDRVHDLPLSEVGFVEGRYRVKPQPIVRYGYTRTWRYEPGMRETAEVMGYTHYPSPAHPPGCTLSFFKYHVDEKTGEEIPGTRVELDEDYQEKK